MRVVAQPGTIRCRSPGSASRSSAAALLAWLRLAIAALDVFGQRSDLFDRRGEIFGPARLLLGARMPLPPRFPPPRPRRRPAARRVRLLSSTKEWPRRRLGFAGCSSAISLMSVSTTSRLDRTAAVFWFSVLAADNDLLKLTAHRCNLILDGSDGVLDAPGIFAGVARQIADILGDHGKALCRNRPRAPPRPNR